MTRRTWDPNIPGFVAVASMETGAGRARRARETQAAPWQLAAALPATTQAVESFCLEVRHRLKGCVSAADWYAVELLLREALTNAVLHGDPGSSGQVSCEVTVRKRLARLIVADEGRGFDWRRALSAAAPDTATSGRGVKIYQLYADRVSFNEAGNRVVLHRRLGRRA